MSNDYTNLLLLTVQLVNSQVAKPTDGNSRLIDAHSLALKFAAHLVSMQNLANTANVEHKGELVARFVDHSSVKVVGRAALETYLVLFYFSGNPDSSLCDFRHRAWHLGGLADRQRIKLGAQKYREKLAEEKKSLGELQKEIESSPHFRAYTAKQQKQLLKGDWKIGKSWKDLSTEAGFFGQWFDDVYGYLCGYSHSSYASALQVRDAQRSIDDQLKLARTILLIGLDLMAQFVPLYAKLFKAENVIDAYPDANKVAEKWRRTPDEMAAAYSNQSQ